MISVWLKLITSTREKLIFLLSLGLFFALVLPSTASASQHSEYHSLSERDLSLEEKVGQLFILGFNGQSFNQSVNQLLQQVRPGGLIIFGRNIKSPNQVRLLNHDLAKWYRDQLLWQPLIMVDQEGGSVARIKTKPPAPSALALGNTENPLVAQLAGKYTGQILRLLGFQMNLAPVADLSSRRATSFIGNRSFGSDPELVGQLVHSYLDGLAESRIIGTAKHFPGHGHIQTDTHYQSAEKSISYETLRKTDLVPYFKLSRRNEPSAVMVGHLSFPRIEERGVPAPFSKKIINGLLRDQLGYNGLVITDDLEMAGAKSIGDIGERAVRAIEAGCDMVMVAWSPARQKRAFNAVVRAVRSGRIKIERIDDSLARIARTKKFAFSGQINAHQRNTSEPNNKVLTQSDSPAELSNELDRAAAALAKLTSQVSFLNFHRAAEKYRGLSGGLKADERIVIASSLASFSASFAKVHPSLKSILLKPGVKVDQVANQFENSRSQTLIYYVSGKITARLLSGLPVKLKKNMIVINGTHPAELDKANYKAVFELHSNDYRSGEWLAHFLKGTPLRRPAEQDD